MTRLLALTLVVLVSTASTGRAWCEAMCVAPQATAEAAGDAHSHCTSGATAAAPTASAPASTSTASLSSGASCEMHDTNWPPAFQANTASLLAAAVAVGVPAPPVAALAVSAPRSADAVFPPSCRRSTPLRI